MLGRGENQAIHRSRDSGGAAGNDIGTGRRVVAATAKMSQSAICRGGQRDCDGFGLPRVRVGERDPGKWGQRDKIGCLLTGDRAHDLRW